MVPYYIKMFFKTYIFYKNDFKNKLENLREFSLFLAEHNIEFYVCGGFSVFLLEKKGYRKSLDIDLLMEDKDSRQLLKILEKIRIPVKQRHRYGTLFFQYKDVAYDIHFYTKINSILSSNYIFGYGNNLQNIVFKMPAEDIADSRYNNSFLKESKIKIAHPAWTFVIMGLVPTKKLDIYYLKKYVSKDALHRILELNPEHRDVFDFGLLDYSLLRWIKDELCGILSKFRN